MRRHEGGVEVDTQGDAFFFSFPTAPGAVCRGVGADGRPCLGADPGAGRRAHRNTAADRRGIRRRRRPLRRACGSDLARRPGRPLGRDRGARRRRVDRSRRAPAEGHRARGADLPARRRLRSRRSRRSRTRTCRDRRAPSSGGEAELAGGALAGSRAALASSRSPALAARARPGSRSRRRPPSCPNTRRASSGSALPRSAIRRSSPRRSRRRSAPRTGSPSTSASGSCCCFSTTSSRWSRRRRSSRRSSQRCPNLTFARHLVASSCACAARSSTRCRRSPSPRPSSSSASARSSSPSEEIGELCARLDNLPLAVELAAARTKALSSAQILERLSERLDLLKGGRDADPRQLTLRATIEWSYELLYAGRAAALRPPLASSPAAARFAAAEEVADADLDTLQSLVEKSLLRFTDERYWMLETIREFAAERLAESGDEGQLRRRHARFFLELAQSLGMTYESIEVHGRQRHDVGDRRTGELSRRRSIGRSRTMSSSRRESRSRSKASGWRSARSRLCGASGRCWSAWRGCRTGSARAAGAASQARPSSPAGGSRTASTGTRRASICIGAPATSGGSRSS